LRDLRSSIKIKHRIHAAIDRYGLQATGISDLFGVKGRVYIDTVLDRLPCDTAAMIRAQLTTLAQLEVQIEEIEERIAVALKPSPEVKLLRTVPGTGEILAPLVWLEIADVSRFPGAENLASYAGLVPRIIASGGRIRCRNTISSGDLSRPLPAHCASTLIVARISNACINGLRPEKETAAPWSPSPVTWPKPAIGCSASGSPTKIPRRVQPAATWPEPVRPGSDKRKTRLTSTQVSG
jgi:hypothetical protein